MKKISAVLFCLYFICSAHAQFNKFISVRAGVQLDLRTDFPSLDDVGAGFNFDVSLFAKGRLMLLTSVHKDWFAGDKLYIQYGSGRINNISTAHGISAGPEYFINRNVAISATYGLFQHSIREDGYFTDDGLRVGVTAYTGNKRRFVLKLCRTDIFNSRRHMSYHSIGLGWRVY